MEIEIKQTSLQNQCFKLRGKGGVSRHYSSISTKLSLSNLKTQSDEEENIEEYNKIYDTLNQLDESEKKKHENINYESSQSMVRQLQDRDDVLKQYWQVMESLRV